MYSQDSENIIKSDFIMKAMLFFFAMIMVASAPLIGLAQENQCGANAVIDGVGYLISPSGGNDTATIQCALDSSVAQGLPAVTLGKGSFKVTGLYVENFEGNFEGTSIATTTLLIDNGTADCGDGYDDTADLITFAGGRVTLRSMTIDVDRPCDRGVSHTAISFVQKACNERTHFGNVDRVDFIGPGLASADLSRAIAMTGRPECRASGDGSLGTFKLNRSTIDGFVVGVATGILGGGQVDINFNEFKQAVAAIVIDNANQSTTITGNTIEYFTDGVSVFSSESYAPTKNRVVIHNNQFRQQIEGTYARGVLVANFSLRTAQSAVISDNSFDLYDRNSEDGQYGIYLLDFDGATLTNNTFEGTATVGIVVDAAAFPQDVTDTVISGNNFLQENSFNDIDIYLGEGTRDSIVGSQNARTDDYGSGNRKL